MHCKYNGNSYLSAIVFCENFTVVSKIALLFFTKVGNVWG